MTIDEEGFRANVGIVLINRQRRLFWARRIGQKAWQFPQGGIQAHEMPEEALYRELKEEVGLMPIHVTCLAQTKVWLTYRLPKQLIRYHLNPLCIGQKQKWFLLRFEGEDELIKLNFSEAPEFEAFRWVSYWYPAHRIVNFKREVYLNALRAFAPVVFASNFLTMNEETPV